MSGKFNDAFWRWFSNSKVVNSDGSPMEVYHGGSTREVYHEFKPRKALRSRGFMGAEYEVDATTYFFSESKRMARLFAENRAEHKGDAWVMGVYLSIQNPLDLTGDLRQSEKLIRVTGSMYWGEGDKTTLWKIFDRPKTVQALIAAGYDGAILFDTDAARFFKQTKDPSAKVTWVAFHPTQIKSSVKNDGTWDADDPDIRSNPPTIGWRESKVREWPEGTARVLENGKTQVLVRVSPKDIAKFAIQERVYPAGIDKYTRKMSKDEWVEPVDIRIYRGDPYIDDGHHRLQAASDLGVDLLAWVQEKP